MYQKILVPIDGSPISNRGLAEAIGLAEITGAQLRLVHVIDQFSMMSSMAGAMIFTKDAIDAMRDAGEEVLQKGRGTVASQGIAVGTALFDDFSGPVSDIVTAEASHWGADLIVLGTHGRRGVGRALLGSDAEQILRHAPVPVLLVRAPSEDGEG